jgi:hypothetical protein
MSEREGALAALPPCIQHRQCMDVAHGWWWPWWSPRVRLSAEGPPRYNEARRYHASRPQAARIGDHDTATHWTANAAGTKPGALSGTGDGAPLAACLWEDVVQCVKDSMRTDVKDRREGQT